MDDLTTIKTEKLRALFDLAVGSMDYGSGFLDRDDVEVIVEVARMLGVEKDVSEPGGPSYDGRKPWQRTEPHLWHQECALDWLCGQPAGDPIHQITLP